MGAPQLRTPIPPWTWGPHNLGLPYPLDMGAPQLRTPIPPRPLERRQLCDPAVARHHAPVFDHVELLRLLGDRLRGIARVEDDEVSATTLREAVALHPDRARCIRRHELRK